ncbi:MAG TPA: hypothetical protein VES20_08090, partial [Bryobacteraceae bacterium]|nr:hypothetical protein [Bryobacteraceae bacterium]
RPLNFRDAWWTPPLSPREAFDLERDNIERGLSKRALVSLTDHDDIEAPMHLRILPDARHIPVSLEWTVPWGPTFFHLGVHNLPAQHAHRTMAYLAACTEGGEPRAIREVLDCLCNWPSVLIVLNHPLWDERGIGPELHLAGVTEFVESHKEWLHAAELNGLRDWQENAAAARFADAHGLLIISGGDRHGREPNAVVNLTHATSFSEFVHEVRYERRSHILFRDHYGEPFRMRILHGLLDAVREYPEFPEGRRRWVDRVFFRNHNGDVKPLSLLWEGDGPAVVKLFVSTVRLLESKPVQKTLRFALAERQGEVAT